MIQIIDANGFRVMIFVRKNVLSISKIQSIQFFWAIGINFKSKLVFPRRKINEFVYGKYGYLFQQLGASPHLTIDTMNFIEE